MQQAHVAILYAFIATVFTYLLNVVGACCALCLTRFPREVLQGVMAFAVGLMIAIVSNDLISPSLHMGEEMHLGAFSFVPACVGVIAASLLLSSIDLVSAWLGKKSKTNEENNNNNNNEEEEDGGNNHHHHHHFEMMEMSPPAHPQATIARVSHDDRSANSKAGAKSNNKIHADSIDLERGRYSSNGGDGDGEDDAEFSVHGGVAVSVSGGGGGGGVGGAAASSAISSLKSALHRHPHHMLRHEQYEIVDADVPSEGSNSTSSQHVPFDENPSWSPDFDDSFDLDRTKRVAGGGGGKGKPHHHQHHPTAAAAVGDIEEARGETDNNNNNNNNATPAPVDVVVDANGVPIADEAQVNEAKWRAAKLFVIALALHHVPEAMACGVAFAAAPNGSYASAVSLSIAMAVQNIPEGMAATVTLLAIGMDRKKAFLLGQLTGAVEPIGGLIGAGAVVLSQSLLAYALSFAGGAMLFVLCKDMIPDVMNHGENRVRRVLIILSGFVAMTCASSLAEYYA